MRNKHLNRGDKNAAILSRLTALADTLKREKEEAYYDDAGADSKFNYTIDVPNATNPLAFTCAKPTAICLFQIRLDGLYPFFLYLLQSSNEQLSFPQALPNKNIIKASISYMNKIDAEASITYAGWSETEDNNIILLRYETKNHEPKPLRCDMRWTSAHEIINTGKDVIHKSVLQFFLTNRDFLYIKKEDKSNYAIPMLGYYYANKIGPNKIGPNANVVDTDIYREQIIPSLGKCYYLFLNLPETIEGKNIIRTIYFPGKMVIYTTKKEENTKVYSCNSILVPALNRIIINHYNQHTVL